MVTPYGYSSIMKVFLLCFLLDATALLMPGQLTTAVVLASSCFLLFTFYFFRDPKREIPDDERIIIAPADGKIILVREHHNSFTGGSSTLISIFMSPLNVHVNRIPVDGKVTLLRYRPGRFHMAFDHRSMEENEKMEIGIDTGSVRVLFAQVSGFLARRIVCKLQEGDAVMSGTRFGMIKFGSRVDVILPSSATVLVRPGFKTRAGETVLARY
ncbi:MAG: phosphatidylserine decarboxylase [Chlorobiaceae bacterium]|nr:phosphatidylserine decarboxylase [Chlorobiaceae bacterium]